MQTLPAIPLFHPAQPEDLAAYGADYVSLYRYWLELGAGAAGAPFWNTFDPIALPRHLSRLWVIEVHGAPPRLRYRLVGTDIVASYGHDPTGRWLDEVWPHLESDYGNRHLEALQSGQPSFRRGRPRMVLNREWGLIENLMLPFRHADCLGVVAGYSHLYNIDGRRIY